MYCRSSYDLLFIQFLSLGIVISLTYMSSNSQQLKLTSFMTYVTTKMHKVLITLVTPFSNNSFLRNKSTCMKHSSLSRSFALSSNFSLPSYILNSLAYSTASGSKQSALLSSISDLFPLASFFFCTQHFLTLSLDLFLLL